MTRTKPLPRRPNATVRVEYRGQQFYVTVGYRLNGTVQEVFGSSSKTSSDIGYLISDACVAISVALQYGARPEELLRSMHTVPVVGFADKTEEPASIIGVILQTIIAEEKN